MCLKQNINKKQLKKQTYKVGLKKDLKRYINHHNKRLKYPINNNLIKHKLDVKNKDLRSKYKD